MEKVSKKIFKEIMEYVKEFEILGNKWCEEDDIGSVARSRSYAKKIMTAMKPYIETTIKEAAIIEATKIEAKPEVVEVPTETKVETKVVATPSAPKVEAVKKEEIKKETAPTKEEVKEVKPVKSGFSFNKNKK